MKKLLPFLFFLVVSCEESPTINVVPIDSIPESASCSVPMFLTTWSDGENTWRHEAPEESITVHFSNGAQCNTNNIVEHDGCSGYIETVSVDLIDGWGGADCSVLVGQYTYQIQGSSLYLCKEGDVEGCKVYEAIRVEGEL
jgi:hypothetical protein